MSENSETCEIIAGLKSTPQELANMLIEAVEDIEPYQLGIMFHNFCKDNQADHKPDSGDSGGSAVRCWLSLFFLSLSK